MKLIHELIDYCWRNGLLTNEQHKELEWLFNNNYDGRSFEVYQREKAKKSAELEEIYNRHANDSDVNYRALNALDDALKAEMAHEDAVWLKAGFEPGDDPDAKVVKTRNIADLKDHSPRGPGKKGKAGKLTKLPALGKILRHSLEAVLDPASPVSFFFRSLLRTGGIPAPADRAWNITAFEEAINHIHRMDAMTFSALLENALFAKPPANVSLNQVYEYIGASFTRPGNECYGPAVSAYNALMRMGVQAPPTKLQWALRNPFVNMAFRYVQVRYRVIDFLRNLRRDRRTEYDRLVTLSISSSKLKDDNPLSWPSRVRLTLDVETILCHVELYNANYCYFDGTPSIAAREIALALEPKATTSYLFPKKSVDCGNGVTMDLVRIPAGTFLMGSPASEAERFDDEVQHQVTLSKPFYLGVYEVTQAQYQAVMGNNPSYFKGGNLPVENVSWDDAVEFCQKLSVKTGRKVRLPTEAEWEYACRAGTTTPFNTGATISTDQANYDGNYQYGDGRKGVYRGKTTAAGSFRPNAWGLYDMHGNVAEWCSDRYGRDKIDDTLNLIGISMETGHVLRGGSWISDAKDCRSALRNERGQGRSDIDYGFRVALD